MSVANAEAVVSCRDAGKQYILSAERQSTFKETVLRAGRVQRSERVIHALRGVSFDVHPGEIVGLIGDNGSGKSTLLKLIAGITTPSTGEVDVRGTVSSLLEVGVGFHPDMTGRENVYLSGSLLGIPRNVLTERIDDIIAFSELHEFIDSPVKHYSSGMYLRLGFAIGVFVNPDVLLIDEILAVGDQSFQRKCKDHVRQLRNSGKTIFVVSHDLDAIVSLCDRALVLNQGVLLGDGRPYEMVTLYKQHQFEQARKRGESPSAEIMRRNRFGRFDAHVTDVRMSAADGERYVFETGETVTIELTWKCPTPIAYPIFGVAIMDDEGRELATVATDVTVGDVSSIQGEGKTVFTFDSLNLLAGAYSLNVGFTQREEGPGSNFNFYEGLDLRLEMCPFMVKPGAKGYGLRGSLYIPCRAGIHPDT
ncbi:MAG: ATP-binding cassette domain-containing protein [bacterium]|nr:ATP-binding cassette domain-containing protein [bacterium]